MEAYPVVQTEREVGAYEAATVDPHRSDTRTVAREVNGL